MKKKNRKKSQRRLITLCILAILLLGVIHRAYKYRGSIQYRISRFLDQEPEDFDHFIAQWSVFGIDVSEYQGTIDWDKVKHIFGGHKISFAFIRATAGKDKIDAQFTKNWEAKKDSNIICGAYHYYRPDENSLEQAQNFINNVKLNDDDLPPVLDIENLSNIQDLKSLRKGLQKWLDKIEEHYGVKPIIYSGSSFFAQYLKADFKGYHIWIANYNRPEKPVDHDWKIWQYCENGQVDGIDGYVDLNVFDGDSLELKKMCRKLKWTI